VGGLSNTAKRLILGAAAPPRPKIKEVEAFLDGDEELFQAPEQTSNKRSMISSSLMGPLTVQLIDSSGVVVATAPVTGVTQNVDVHGRVDMRIDVRFDVM
jgi:hypothetical protein